MYVADERFKNNIDKHASGTAKFICQAIEAIARNEELKRVKMLGD